MNEASDLFYGGFSISRTDLLWRESVGVCGGAGEMWPLTRLPADQGSLASHVSITVSVTNSNILGVRRKISLQSVI